MPKQTRQGIETRDGRGGPIFIHSELDDYGLTLVEFRVYARLARRCGDSEAWESVPNMARDFGVNDRTVQRALKLLILARLVSATLRPGHTTVYKLLPLREWVPSGQLPALRARIVKPKKAQMVTAEPEVSGDIRAGGQKLNGDIRAGGVVTLERGVVVTSQPDEGSPSESSPLKGRKSHTHRAPARGRPSAARAARAGGGGASHLSRFDFQTQCVPWAEAAKAADPSIRSARALARARWKDGTADDEIAAWLESRTPQAVTRSLQTPTRTQMGFRAALIHVRSILDVNPMLDIPGCVAQLDVSEETRAQLLSYDFSKRRGAVAVGA